MQEKKCSTGCPRYRLPTRLHGRGRGREVKVYHKFITMVKSQLNNIKRLMKTFYNSHFPEQ